jgi:oligoendopeptidase F
MSKDTRRFHEGLSAEAQDQFNKLSRAHQDVTRRDLNDEIMSALRAHREHILLESRNRRPHQRSKESEEAIKNIRLGGEGTPGKRGELLPADEADEADETGQSS